MVSSQSDNIGGRVGQLARLYQTFKEVGVVCLACLERFGVFIVTHERENLVSNPFREALNLLDKRPSAWDSLLSRSI